MIVVDEAVLALSGYELADPLVVFYGQLTTYLSTTYGRQSILLVDPATLEAGLADGGDTAAGGTATTAASAGAPAGVARHDRRRCRRVRGRPRAEHPGVRLGVGRGRRRARLIGERTNFDPLAVFAPDVTTDADGRAVVDVPLPDNLTRYRVMAVAVAGADRFGSGGVDHHRPPAADGAAVGAALPQLRRPLRAAGGRAEPDRPGDDGRRRAADGATSPRGRRRCRQRAVDGRRPTTASRCASRSTPTAGRHGALPGGGRRGGR